MINTYRRILSALPTSEWRSFWSSTLNRTTMTTVWPTSSPTGTLTTASSAWPGSGLLQVGAQLQTRTQTPGVVQRHDGNLRQLICTLSVWFTDPLLDTQDKIHKMQFINIYKWLNVPVWVCLILYKKCWLPSTHTLLHQHFLHELYLWGFCLQVHLNKFRHHRID